MKNFLAAFFILLCGSFSIQAQDISADEKRKVLVELANILRIEEGFTQTMDIMLAGLEISIPSSLQAEIEKTPDLSEAQKKELVMEAQSTHQRISRKFRERFGSVVNVKGYLDHMFYSVYGKYFTIDELKELVAFYKTPTGKKTIDTMPQIMTESMKSAHEYLSPGIEKLTKEIFEEELERLGIPKVSSTRPLEG